jgi:hypothetical protein
MPDRVDAAMETMQVAAPGQARDLVAAQSEADHLRARDNAVLTSGERSDRCH